ncbi:MAG: flagellar M-ring protein FliF [Ignavibacteriales bacterium]|nr:flagellar M-ring protein FliF [Ignavibacteriales bacterium]
MEFLRQLKEQFVGLTNRLTTQQRVLGAFVLVAVIVGFVGLVVFSGPTYQTLYSNLPKEEAAQIIKKLDEKNIPYKLDDDGKTIKVPDAERDKLLISLAGEGIPMSGVVGYEIFDKTNLGISDQTQKINRVRALEGELTRTILQVENMEAARVHIVLPEKRFFREDQKPATASVWLKARGNMAVSPEIAQGIAHLVASSVEGLDASNVRIFDRKGILRSNARAQNSISGGLTSNMELQLERERLLSQKVQGMLDIVVGPGNSYVEVSAEVDFRQVNRTQEIFDPEDQVIRSEQVTEQSSTTTDTSRVNAKNITSSNSNTVTNYEIGKTVELSTSNGGDVKRLSVSAVINGRYADRFDSLTGEILLDENDQPVKEYVSLSSEEIGNITELIKKQIGFAADRGDQIAVVNMQFFGDKDLTIKEDVRNVRYLLRWCMEKLYDPNTWLLFFFMILATFLLYRMASRIRFKKELESAVALQRAAKVAPRSRVTGGPTLEPIRGLEGVASELKVTEAEELGEEELKVQQETRERVKQYFRDKPEEASSLLKVWLADEHK